MFTKSISSTSPMFQNVFELSHGAIFLSGQERVICFLNLIENIIPYWTLAEYFPSVFCIGLHFRLGK